jgi:hypothetical protein
MDAAAAVAAADACRVVGVVALLALGLPAAAAAPPGHGVIRYHELKYGLGWLLVLVLAASWSAVAGSLATSGGASGERRPPPAAAAPPPPALDAAEVDTVIGPSRPALGGGSAGLLLLLLPDDAMEHSSKYRRTPSNVKQERKPSL